MTIRWHVILVLFHSLIEAHSWKNLLLISPDIGFERPDRVQRAFEAMASGI